MDTARTNTVAPLSVAALRAELWALRMSRAPMKLRAAKLAEMEAAERAEGPALPPTTPREVCCPRAVVSHGCTCAHVTTCPTHGTRHHGTHD